MQIFQVYQKVLAFLQPDYGEREAANMARLLLEDGFQLKDPVRNTHTLTPDTWTAIQSACDRLLAHEPLQYVLGFTWFYGLKLRVDQRVLIPRPETEELVHLILQDLPVSSRGVLDVGAGSGCIALALKKERPAWEVYAADISEGALEVCRENARALGLEVGTMPFDLFNDTTWPAQLEFDLIVSNPPYIPLGEADLLAPNVGRYEPAAALFTGNDPLEPYRALLQFSLRCLSNAGSICMECHHLYARDIVELFKGCEEYTEVRLHQDMQGKDRMVIARKKP